MAHARQRARCGDSMTSRQPIGAPRNAPSDATAERALLFAPVVPRRSVGPHAWSRARVNRLAPRKEPKPSGEGSPFTTALRAGVVLSHPQKLVCWGPGNALAVCRVSSIQILMGPRTSALNSRHWNPWPPLPTLVAPRVRVDVRHPMYYTAVVNLDQCIPRASPLSFPPLI